MAYLSSMEHITIRLLDVRRRERKAVALTVARTEHARLLIEVRFDASDDLTSREYWQLAYDQVLRYLDPL